jgi:hypothetical protein
MLTPYQEKLLDEAEVFYTERKVQPKLQMLDLIRQGHVQHLLRFVEDYRWDLDHFGANQAEMERWRKERGGAA